MTTWNAEQAAKFFALEDVAEDRDRTAWWVAFTTGVRRGELLGLRWRDADLETGTLTIAQTCGIVDHKITIRPGTKTGKGRTLEIDETTVAELRSWRARQAQELLVLGRKATRESLMFARLDGAPFDADRFSERFIRLVQRHPELPRIRFHDIRHSHATILLRAGVPLIVVSRRLGHKSIAITADTYGHVSAEMQSDAAAKGVGLILEHMAQTGRS